MRSDGTCPHAGEAPMWARYVIFKKRHGQAANYFFETAGSGNLAGQQFHLPQQISVATVVCRF
jgi:hypothetical protein